VFEFILSPSVQLAERLSILFSAVWTVTSLVLVVCVFMESFRLAPAAARPSLLRRIIFASAILEFLVALPMFWYVAKAEISQQAVIRNVRLEANAERQMNAVASTRITSLERQIDDRAEAQQSLENEVQDLKQSLGQTDEAFTQLKKRAGVVNVHQKQRHLTAEDRRVLVASLKPYAGQGVQVFSIAGDSEGRVYRNDLARMFEQAGWNHDGDRGVTEAEFDVDPVGITLILHAVDAGHGHTNRAINALIATLKRQNLLDGGGIFVSDQVPDGWVKIAIGKNMERPMQVSAANSTMR
jgi:hypothetical protein